MDPFDEHIIKVLRDGNPRDFHQLLDEVSFSHNTLRLHLVQLVEQGLVVRQKKPQKGHGRPQFNYTMLKGVDGRVCFSPRIPYKGLVVLSLREVMASLPARESKIL